MTAAMAWFVAVLSVLALVLTLHSLGYDVGATLGNAVRGAEHFLGQPLFST